MGPLFRASRWKSCPRIRTASAVWGFSRVPITRYAIFLLVSYTLLPLLLTMLSLEELLGRLVKVVF